MDEHRLLRSGQLTLTGVRCRGQTALSGELSGDFTDASAIHTRRAGQAACDAVQASRSPADIALTTESMDTPQAAARSQP
jgi:hypothetical protein